MNEHVQSLCTSTECERATNLRYASDIVHFVIIFHTDKVAAETLAVISGIELSFFNSRHIIAIAVVTAPTGRTR